MADAAPQRRISAIRQQVHDAFRERWNSEVDGWHAVPREFSAVTVRWTQDDIPTPDHARLPFQSSCGTAPALYPFDTYSRHVFVTLVNQKVLVRRSPCPWVLATDQEVTLKRALAVLLDPYSAL